MIKYLFSGLILTIILSTGCKKTSPVPVVNAGSISLNYQSLVLQAGDTTTLKATILPANTTNKNVTWSSSDVSIATVASGSVQTISKGVVKISAQTQDGSQTATCDIIVKGISDLVDGGPGYLLENDSTENVFLSFSSLSKYNTIITEYAIYNSKNVVIQDQKLIPAYYIIFHQNESSNLFVGTGNVHVQEPGYNKGVYIWTIVIYFDNNGKHYKLTINDVAHTIVSVG